MFRRMMHIQIEEPSPAHLTRMKAVLEATSAEIDGVVSSVVHDALPLNNSPYTLVWETVFKDQAALDHYRDHPYHTGPIRDVFTEVKFQTASAFVAQ